MSFPELSSALAWLFGFSDGPWLLRSAFSVWGPAAVLVYALVAHRRSWSAELWAYLLAAALLGLLYATWVDTSEGASLFIPPFFVACVVGGHHRARFYEPSVLFGACFLSLLIPDVLSAFVRFGTKDLYWLQGVGGAGIRDGLLMFPLLCLVIQHYAKFRLKAAHAKSPSL